VLYTMDVVKHVEPIYETIKAVCKDQGTRKRDKTIKLSAGIRKGQRNVTVGREPREEKVRK
jgi:hypothetical protein